MFEDRRTGAFENNPILLQPRAIDEILPEVADFSTPKMSVHRPYRLFGVNIG